MPTAGGESELGGGGVLSKAKPCWKAPGSSSGGEGIAIQASWQTPGQALPRGARVRLDGLTQSLQTAAQAGGPADALILLPSLTPHGVAGEGPVVSF